MGNHVYHSRYLDILELARGEFFRSLGHTFAALQESDAIFPIIECQLTFKAPARYDDLITVELWIIEAERIRLTFGCRVVNAAGSLLADGATYHVCTSLHDKPKRIPADLVSALAPYMEMPTSA